MATKRPFTQSWMISGIPPTGVRDKRRPHINASSITNGNPSWFDTRPTASMAW